MELVAQKHGYRLTIGAHDVFLRLEDIEELRRKAERAVLSAGANRQGVMKERPVAADVEPGTVCVAHVSKMLLETMTPGQELRVLVPIDSIRSMFSTITQYSGKSGRRFKARVSYRKNYWDDVPYESRVYVITRTD